MTSHKKAIIYILLSALSFSLMQVFVKLSGPDIPLFEKIFVRNLLISFGVLLLIKKEKKSLRVPKKARLPLLLRCVFGYLGVAGYFFATQKMLLGDANAIQQSSPIFVVLFSALIVKEGLTKDKLLSVLLGFLGVLLIVKPSFSSSVLPALVGLSGSLGAALAYVFISYLGDEVEGEVVILAFSIFSSLASLPFLIGSFVIPRGLALIYLLSIGIFGGLGQYFVTYGYRQAKAGEISIYSYASIIFSAVFGVLLFNEFPDILSLLGMGIIILAGYLLFYFRKKVA